MFLTLERIKQHLNLDTYYTADDAYLMALESVVEKVVQRHIDTNLEELAESEGGELPQPLLHAMLLLIGNFYANRESVTSNAQTEIPLSYNYLLDLFKNYNNTKMNS